MLTKLVSRLTYANVASTLALFLALGGVSYAAVKLPRNSVGARQLKKNAVTPVKIKNRAVTATKIARNAVTGFHVDEATLSAVPEATHAVSAESAKTASSAGSATTAGDASTLNGYGASELARAARASGSNAIAAGVSPSDGVTVATVSVTAPKAGFVLLTGGTSEYATTPAGCPCEVGNYFVDTVAGTISGSVQFDTAGADGNYTGNANTWVFPVAAGTRTFQLQAYRLDGSSEITVAGTVTALYVPFGSTGGSLLGASALQTHGLDTEVRGQRLTHK